MKKKLVQTILIWIAVIAALSAAISLYNISNPKPDIISYSKFEQKISDGEVKELIVQDSKLTGKSSVGDTYISRLPIVPKSLMDLAKTHQVDVEAKASEKAGILNYLFSEIVSLLIFFVGIGLVLRYMQGGGKGPMSVGRSKAKLLAENQVKVTLKDVAGLNEAREEVSELIEFLKTPKKFKALGGRIPKGVLMVGPPGTGKTLLARAIAGEAKVPFFTISGSDFVEMFVGVGASRVRDMFEQAKKKAPCIIFIDEIDAVGRHRSSSSQMGGHDEREQTLNQLLVEMDGFEAANEVIIIAATNRPDVLDSALLRPGRFDRRVAISLPDIKGRENILKVHSRKIPLAKDVNLNVIARGTPGFSGAHLANLTNEAALLASRENCKSVRMKDLESAKDKIIMGVEMRSMVLSEKELKNTAYHEAGHAIVGLLVPSHDPVYKVTIIPRGQALGVTFFLPENDQHSQSKEHLESKLSSVFGGRIAEELIFGKDQVTTGASNDIKVATEIARNMVTKWGLSDKLGPLTYVEEEGNWMIQGQNKPAGKTAQLIDDEVRKIVDKTYKTATKILQDNIDKLHIMAEALLKYETIDSKQIANIMAGEEPGAPENW